jgi:polyphosphate glucokinase
MTDVRAIGIDIGGTGVKAGLVDTATGDLIGDWRRVPTPPDCGPEEMGAIVKGLVEELSPNAPVGIGFPGPVVHGRIMAATHLAKSWVGCEAADFFMATLGRRCVVLNDADAAAIAEMRFGVGVGEAGVVLMLTLGTGIGSALFVDGVLVPNLELGHIEIAGAVAEDRAAAKRKVDEGLSWEQWAARLETYLQRIDALVWSDVIILGGEITVESKNFLPLLHVRPRVEIAQLRNAAGTVGAALSVAGGLSAARRDALPQVEARAAVQP